MQAESLRTVLDVDRTQRPVPAGDTAGAIAEGRAKHQGAGDDYF